MCARISLTTTAAEIADLFNISDDRPLFPRFNIAPSQSIPVVRMNGGTRELAAIRWGLIPHWNTDPRHAGFVNARAETAPEKPAFRDAFRRRRCLVPADGFYEWKTRGKRKQPYFFRHLGGGPMAYAAIWDAWTGLDTVAVLTTTANELVRPLHDRMPAILDPERFEAWLNPKELRPEKLLPLIGPYSVAKMESWPVSDRVNSVRNEEPGLNAMATPRVTWEQPSLFEV